MTKTVAVYPGSFDPITMGHLDVIRRSAKLFDVLYVAIGKSADKVPLFSDGERELLVKEVVSGIPGVEVAIFGGLAVDFARKVNAQALVRGVRSVSDFTYEMQMAQMNRSMASQLETIFVPTDQVLGHISASLVRDIAKHKGPIEKMVPPQVVEPLREKFSSPT